MRIGFVGLGKLGMPVATAMAKGGHDVLGYDVNNNLMNKNLRTYIEAGPDGTGSFDKYLVSADKLNFAELPEIINHSDVVFFAVQTPHAPQFEGITPLIYDEKSDFDYTYLNRAIDEASKIAEKIDRKIIFAVISTVLPGTLYREIVPKLPDNVSLVYNPSFIAMGTTMKDYLHPEFVLVGGDPNACDIVAQVHMQSITGNGISSNSVPVKKMSIVSAELTKVAYNTYIGAKIAIANTLMEICHHFDNADIDDVSEALMAANGRIASGAYMRGGMGDGGGCHPRDNIAMSWLAEKLGLSYDIFIDIMQCREGQAAWLVNLMLREKFNDSTKLAILGTAYKPGTNLTYGSSALLVENIFREIGEKVESYDHKVFGTDLHSIVNPSTTDNCVVLIGCKHPEFKDVYFSDGCTVIDPFRYIPDHHAGKVIRIGEGEPDPRTHGVVVTDTISMQDV